MATASRVRVRLVAHDGDATVGVISTSRTAMWGSATGYAAMQARATATANRYDIWAAIDGGLPGGDDDRMDTRRRQRRRPGHVRDDGRTSRPAPPATCSGCAPTTARSPTTAGGSSSPADSAGNRRVVNDVPVEGYLRGVVPREVSTSWGNAGGGAGMNALRAQAVAARSYALSQNRYAGSGGYATTCDTHGVPGLRRRRPPLQRRPRRRPAAARARAATPRSSAPTPTGRSPRRPDGSGARRAAPIVSTEFSASNGPRTAGGTFPAINDPFDDVPQNPNHRWTRIVDGDLVAAAYGLGTLTAATTEPDPATPFVGVWDNRVRLTGTGGTVRRQRPGTSAPPTACRRTGSPSAP